MAKRAARTTKRTAGSATMDTTPAPQTFERLTGQLSEDEVRMRAYHRYLERGATHGNDLEDWVEAEKELKIERRP